MFNSLSSGGNSASGISSTTSSINRIPHDLILLIRIIMRTFYSFELYLCMEMLLIYPCIKEEDLADLLRLDAKVVHQHLLNLKREKFVSERSIMVTSDDGTKMTKHSYFYINYQMMVNVIKYKLDKISNQIESEEKQFTTRPNFKCTHCHKTYSDLDTKDIFLTMRCLYCGSEVEEDVSSMPQRTTRNLMSKFNIQMKIIFDLLKKVDHVKIADDLLRPDPVDMKPILSSIMPGAASTASTANGTNGKQANGVKTGKEEIWSGEKTRKTDLLGQTRISINFDSTNGMSSADKAKKEMPSILALNRRHEEDLYATTSRDSILLEKVKLAAEETSLTANGAMSSLGMENVNKPILNGSSTANGGLASTKQQPSNSVANGSSSNLEVVIMQKLLKHEKKATNTNGAANDDFTQIKHKRSFNEINSNGDQLNHTNALTNGSHTHFNHAQRLSDEHAESIKKRKLNNGGKQMKHLVNLII
jgi:transcription initiation factor IIE alpha subunit